MKKPRTTAAQGGVLCAWEEGGHVGDGSPRRTLGDERGCTGGAVRDVEFMVSVMGWKGRRVRPL